MTPTTPREALDSLPKIVEHETVITGNKQTTTKKTQTTIYASPADILAALKPWLMEWRDDDPPQDGQYIIVWDALHGFALRVRFSEGAWVSEFHQWSGRFKYWMPNIKPPQVTK